MGSILTTRLVDGDSARVELDAAEIRVVAGPDRGFRRELDGSSLLIGSDGQCDVVLHDSSVSARHAEILVVSRGYVLRDLDSTNGVRLGPHLVERVALSDRMRLTMGETTIAVRALGRIVSIPLERPGQMGELVAHSVKMRAFVAALGQLAASDATVLLEGETGTGKELAAETLHAASPRSHGPFVAFDCAGATRSLAAAELFGHDRGAFTGAHEEREGIYERADGGTLFLDEVAELPLDLQPLLLGALERGSTRRLGGRAAIPHDVRVIAATSRNLSEEVRAGRFRQDLFYRLAVARIRLPPLRERAEDLTILAAGFAREAGVILQPELVVLLKAYEWPGNVRELRNVIQRASFDPDLVKQLVDSPRRRGPEDGPGGSAWIEALFAEAEQLRSLPDARRQITDVFERHYVQLVLDRSQGNLSRAAELAGVTRQAITLLANKHGLHPRKG